MARRIVADGFSCREQIEQLTGRKTQHIAEVVADAWGIAPPSPPPPSRAPQLFAAGALVGAGLALGLWAASRNPSRPP